jgi:hypothetical protein
VTTPTSATDYHELRFWRTCLATTVAPMFPIARVLGQQALDQFQFPPSKSTSNEKKVMALSTRPKVIKLDIGRYIGEFRDEKSNSLKTGPARSRFIVPVTTPSSPSAASS